MSVFSWELAMAQNEYFSAINPALFTYTEADVYIKQPEKYNEGHHLLSPDPASYPWESRLENGMPNVLVDQSGNLSVYFSSFIVFSPTPPSKVGVMVFTNTSNSFNEWQRPNAGLYWYNSSGSSSDEKIKSVYASGYQQTNIVAVDIESLGIFDDGGHNNPIKLIYMPQREFQYKYLGAFSTARSFDNNGILSAFSKLKNNRLGIQSILTFKNINADSHMNWLRHGADYLFTSRVNGRRSALLPDEIPPFTSDPRKRYRRSTITSVGEGIESENVDFNVVLDSSTEKWEPYSMQPFQMPGYESDVWYGLVTMYGSDDYPDVAMKQRTELAISNNGRNWRYLKPGTPFLDNGADPTADDFGCINVATPVYASKLHVGRNPLDPYFFYASSNIGHTEGRNPGLSLAMSHYGKIAGLKNEGYRVFYSPSPISVPGMGEEHMPHLSIKNSFDIDAKYFPQILGDITEDPSGKQISQIGSYAFVRIFEYKPTSDNGIGDLLAGSFGSSIAGTSVVSDEFVSLPYIENGVDGNSKQMLINYLKKYSDSHPSEIVSFKDYPEIPVILETDIKNATFYGLKFESGCQGRPSLIPCNMNEYKQMNLWSCSPSDSEIIIENFKHTPAITNSLPPTKMTEGTIAIQANPANSGETQTLLRIDGDSNNYITVDYLSDGSFNYRLIKDGIDYINLRIPPRARESFIGKECVLTIECVKNANRKFNRAFDEETTVMRLACPELNFEGITNQDIIYNFRREVPTPVDTCYARGFAYLAFTGFVGNLDTITVGASDSSGSKRFRGSISIVEIADQLPEGETVFWTQEPANRRKKEE